MPLVMKIEQAVQLTHYFREKNITGDPGLHQIKKLSQQQRKICLHAFKLVENATEETFKNRNLVRGNLSKKVIKGIKTKLIEPDPAGPPVDEPWYKIPINWIAQKVNSLIKGFANLFWRVGSQALLSKFEDYQTDVFNAHAKLDKYKNGKPATTAEKRIARYKQAKDKIKAARKDFVIKKNQVKELTEIHSKLRRIEYLLQDFVLQRDVAARIDLTNDDLSRINRGFKGVKKVKNVLDETVLDVMKLGLEIAKRPKNPLDGTLKYGDLEDEILRPLEERVTLIDATYAVAPKPEKARLDKELYTEYRVATTKYIVEKTKLFEINTNKPDYENSFAKAKRSLEDAIDYERRLQHKEKLIKDKYPSLR